MQTSRPRRTSAEVRTLVLSAARDVFAHQGFAGATTREIAELAGVRESTIFRIFATKQAMYEASVVEPFRVFMQEFRDRWLAAPVPGGDPESVLRQFVVELHDLARENRDVLRAAQSAPASDAVQAAFHSLEQVGEAISRTYGLKFDIAVAVRIATVAVGASALTEDSIFAGYESSRIQDELVRMLVGATLYREGPGPSRRRRSSAVSRRS